MDSTAIVPPDGATIVFDRVPHGSWCRAGEPVKVRVRGRHIWFTDPNGARTSDPAWAVKRASWRFAEQR